MNQFHLICHSQTPRKCKYINSEKLLLVLSIFLIEESTKLHTKIEWIAQLENLSMHIRLGLYDVKYLNKETKCPELPTRVSLETDNASGYTFMAILLTCTFCNIFDHQAIVGLENQFSVLLRAAVLRRFYCIIYYLLVLRNCYLEVDFLAWDLYIQYPYCGGMWYYTTY